MDKLLEIDTLKKENKQLKQDLKDACEVIEMLKKDKKKAIEYINNYLPNYDFDHSNLEKLLQILGDKE